MIVRWLGLVLLLSGLVVGLPVAAATRATCTSSSASGRMGSVLHVSCVGFGIGEDIFVSWDSSRNPHDMSLVTDTKGAASGNVPIAELTGGVHKLFLNAPRSGNKVAIPITVTSYIKISPSSGAARSTVRFATRGLSAGETISIVFMVSSRTARTVAANLVVGPNGTATGSFVVPTTAFGPHTVRVMRGTKQGPGTTFKTVAQPGIQISVKSTDTNGHSTNGKLLAVGDTVTFASTVKNTGNYPLKNVAVVEDKGTPRTTDDKRCTIGTLAPGASSTKCKRTRTLLSSDTTDTDGAILQLQSKAAGDFNRADLSTAEDETIQDTETSVVAIFLPRIQVDVAIVSPGRDWDGVASLGETLTINYLVHNTGTAPLTNVLLADTILGSLTCPKTALAPNDQEDGTGDDEMTCSRTQPITAEFQASLSGGAFASTSRVDGDSPGVSVFDTAPLAFTFTPLSLSVTPGRNYDQTNRSVNDPVSYTYTLFNGSGGVLTDVSVADRWGVACSGLSLAAGESTTCTRSESTIMFSDDDYRTNVIRDPDQLLVNTTPRIKNVVTAGGLPENGTRLSVRRTTFISITVHPLQTFNVQAEIDGHVVTSALVGDHVEFVINGIQNIGDIPMRSVDVSWDSSADSIHDCMPDVTLALAVGATTHYCDGRAFLRVTITESMVTDSDGPIFDPRAFLIVDWGFGGLKTFAPAAIDIVQPVPQLSFSIAATDGSSTITSAHVGDSVTYKYTVRNTGNVILKNLKVTDTKLGTISCPRTTLNLNDGISGSGTDETVCIKTYTIQAADPTPFKITASADTSQTEPKSASRSIDIVYGGAEEPAPTETVAPPDPSATIQVPDETPTAVSTVEPIPSPTTSEDAQPLPEASPIAA